jgi:hypothetical protein
LNARHLRSDALSFDGAHVFPNKRGWYTGHDNMIKRNFLPLFDVVAEKH